jgi:hypothetical protein
MPLSKAIHLNSAAKLMDFIRLERGSLNKKSQTIGPPEEGER